MSNRAHICGVLPVACLLSVSAICPCFLFVLSIVVSSLSISFVCILDWLSAYPLWAKTRPLFHFSISLHIFFLVKGATLYGELVSVSGFLSLHFCMAGIVLSAAYINCCP